MANLLSLHNALHGRNRCLVEPLSKEEIHTYGHISLGWSIPVCVVVIGLACWVGARITEWL